MAKKRFNLADYDTREMSKMDALPRKRLEYVPLSQIRPDPENFYSTDGLEALADNILTVGLIDPPWLRQIAPGDYQVISGHRRRLALQILAERGDFPADGEIPAFIERGEAELPGVEDADRNEAAALFERLRLVMANSDTREKTPGDKTREVRELTELFTALKKLGYRFPGKLREHVAAAAHVSESRVARLNVIDKNLTAAPLREAFFAGRLGENAAYEIARRGADVIGRVEELPVAMVCEMTIERLGAVLEGLEKKAAEDAAEAKAYNDGVKAMGEAQPAAKAAESPTRSKFDADAYIRERTAEDLRYLDMAGALLDQLIHRIPGVIHNRREGIDALKHALRWSSLGGASVNYDGRGNGLELYRRGSSERLLRSWTEAYDTLCAAAINRLGKNSAWDGEDPEADGPPRASAPTATLEDAGPHWNTGEPEEPGWYCCWATCEPETHSWDPDREFLYWSDGWYDSPRAFYNKKPSTLAVHMWWPVPDDPKEEEAGE